MKKKLLLSMLFLTVALLIKAQPWLIYDASALPTESDPAWDPSCDEPGPTTVDSIIQLSGNSLLYYAVPEAADRKAYKIDIDGMPGQQMTLVVRMKGLSDVGPLDRMFDLELRNGNAGLRDKVYIHYSNEIELDNAGPIADLPFDVKDWHIYRFTIDSNMCKVYVDEISEPIIEGATTNSTSDVQVKIGDCSTGGSNGAIIDWVIFRADGAFAPDKAPVPRILSTDVAGKGLRSGKIYFLSRSTDVDSTGTLYDQGVIDSLRIAGYSVNVIYATDPDFSFDALEDADLVIIGRNISSGDFGTDVAEDWASIETPVLMLSGYIIRNNRLKFANTGSVVREIDTANMSNMDRITKAKVVDPSDEAFDGVSVNPADSTMDYMTWFYDYLGYGADTFATTNNGKLLAYITDADTARANGNVLMARWSPGVETYTGSGVIPNGLRSYVQMGADDKSNPKVKNFTQWTGALYQVMLQEIDLLMNNSRTLLYLTRPSDTTDLGVLHDQEVIDSLMTTGYKVELDYPTNPDFDYNNLNRYDLVLIGRNISSGDFGTDVAETWAMVETPVMALSGYIMRNNRLMMINSGSVNREIDTANMSNMDRITKAKVVAPDDMSFDGVTVNPADSTMDYMTWFYDYMGCGQDTFATTNNGKLLAYITDADTARANGNVLMVRWEPFVETYPGSGVSPVAYRSYMQMGGDDKSSPKVKNFAQWTDASYQLMINEIKYLMSTQPGTIIEEISSDATLDSLVPSAGELTPVFDSSVTNYTVILPVGTTEVPAMHVVTSSDKAGVEIIDAATLAGTTIVRVTAQDDVTIINYLVKFHVISDDATLSSLEVDVGTLVPDFDQGTTDYTLEVSASTTAINITAVANHDSATVAGDGEFTDIPGTATITVTAESGDTQDYTIEVTVEVGLDESMLEKVNFYPNPVNKILNVDVPSTGSIISIYNALGEAVIEIEAARKHVQIDVSELNAGLYFIKLEDSGEVVVSKFYKQ
jgi:hypothetical protein